MMTNEYQNATKDHLERAWLDFLKWEEESSRQTFLALKDALLQHGGEDQEAAERYFHMYLLECVLTKGE